MKPSIHKALVLSLSVLVLAGSGCERRGRAPAKPANPSAPTTASKAPTNATATNTPETQMTVPRTKSGDVIVYVPTMPNEAKLEADANMDCKAPAIVGGKISVDEFIKDLKTMNDYLACMGAAGFRPICTDEAGKPCTEATLALNSTITINADPKDSPVKNEFVRMSKEKDDEVAFVATSARLELSVIRLGKMSIKYNADALKAVGIDADADFKFAQSDITINGTLLRLAKTQKALEDNRENIEQMKYYSGRDGVAPSQDDVKLDTQSNAQNAN